MAWSIDLSTANVSVANQITFQSFATVSGTPLNVTIFGSGLTYTAGVLTGGTITHMQIIDPTTGGAGTAIQTVTMTGGLAAASFGSYMSQVQSLGAELSTWNFQFIEQEPTFTPTLVTLHGANGERIELVGSGFAEGSYLGTITSATHYNASNVVLHQVTGLNAPLYAGAGALGSDEATYSFLTQGSNTVTALSSAYPFLSLDGGLGADTIDGLSATLTDRVDYRADVTGGVVVNLTTNSATGGGGTDVLSNIEHVGGTDFADQITGNSSGNNLSGEGGNDILSGLDGNDFLFGGAQDDQLSGGNNDDSLNGDQGNDTLNGGAGSNNLHGGSGNDTFIYLRDANVTFVGDFAVQHYVADMDGGQEVPAVATSGEGFASLQLNRAQTQLQVFVSFFGLSSGLTDMHIHNAPVGVGGGVVFAIGTGTVGGQQSGSVQVNWTTGLAAQLANLNAGTLYVNAHTTNFGGGEIRGQIAAEGTSADRVDLTSLNIGSMEALGVITDEQGGAARIFTQLNGVQSSMFLNSVSEASLLASDFIFTTANAAENIAGTGGMDDLFGAAGNDTITGLGNGDRLFGEFGEDSLDGGNDDDALYGGDGNDVLVGGSGSDSMSGGGGEDSFRFALAELEMGVIDEVVDYTTGSDVLRFLTSVGGDTVTTAAGEAIVTFGNGYQIELTGKAGQIIRLDFDNRFEYWDTGSNALWSHYTDYINGLGQITDQEIVNDNGTLTQRHINQAGAQEYTDYFNGASPRQLTDQEVIRFDGVIEQRHYDVPGDAANPEWTQYIDYIVGGVLRDQEIRFDNGTIGQRHIGQAGTLEYTDYVTPGGVLLDQEVINLDGTREQRHYDPAGTRSSEWSSYIDYFNAANPAQITARSMIYDGTGFQDQWQYSTPGSTAHGTLNHYNNLGVLIGTEMF